MKTLLKLFLFAGAGLWTGLVAGQNPDYTLRAHDVMAVPGTVATVPIDLDIAPSADPVLGFSFSLCSDSTVAIPLSVEVGEDLANVNFGSGPAFFASVVTDDGVGVVALLDLISIGFFALGPGADQEMAIIDYDMVGPIGSVTDLEFCESIGSPPVATVLAILTASGVESAEPTTDDGSLGGSNGTQVYGFTAPDVTATFEPATGIGSFNAGLTIAELSLLETETHGFSMGLAHDANLLSVTTATPAGPLLTLNGGSGPDFFGVNILTGGFTLGVVYSFAMPDTIVFSGTPETVVVASYGTVPGAFLGSSGEVTTLDWMDGLGAPPVDNLVVISVAGDTVGPNLVNGVVTLVPGGGFVRGDCNADGTYQIGDPVALLGLLFLMQGPAPCDEACDANDDGVLGLPDAIYLLSNLFINGPDPFPPFSDCGADPTADSLTCGSFPPC